MSAHDEQHAKIDLLLAPVLGQTQYVLERGGLEPIGIVFCVLFRDGDAHIAGSCHPDYPAAEDFRNNLAGILLAAYGGTMNPDVDLGPITPPGGDAE